MSKFLCRNCGEIFTKEIKTQTTEPKAQCTKCKSTFTRYLSPNNVEIKTKVKVATTKPNVDFNNELNNVFRGLVNNLNAQPQQNFSHYI